MTIKSVIVSVSILIVFALAMIGARVISEVRPSGMRVLGGTICSEK